MSVQEAIALCQMPGVALPVTPGMTRSLADAVRYLSNSSDKTELPKARMIMIEQVRIARVKLIEYIESGERNAGLVRGAAEVYIEMLAAADRLGGY